MVEQSSGGRADAGEHIGAGKLNVAGVVVAAAGIVVQIASGSERFPTIPPGPIILLAGAAVVALGPWRWTPVVGVGGIVAAFVSGAFVDQLTDPGKVGVFAGTWLTPAGCPRIPGAEGRGRQWWPRS